METLEKLSPHRDLQCYFFEPSAIAALSSASASGFTVSGSWRQQFDWAVIEWNRDDVFEHPSLRPLPDGDLSGLTLSYQETRTNCIRIDSSLFATVDWPALRIWANDGTGEKVYRVPLLTLATPIDGDYRPATAQISLTGTVTAGDYAGFAFFDEHYAYQFNAGDTIIYGLQQLVAAVEAFSPTMSASLVGSTITLTYSRPSDTTQSGANGNRAALYTFVSGTQTEQWDVPSRQFAGGTSPDKWQVIIPFGTLVDPALGPVPTHSVRKLRWTYSADLQPASFVRSEFQVVVSNWTVTGTGRTYSIAAPVSQRIEDTSPAASYSGTWSNPAGNFSGGFIHLATSPSSSATCTYTANASHQLYLGSRYSDSGTTVSFRIDGSAAASVSLQLAGEDVLARILIGTLPAGHHTVTLTHQGAAGTSFYFDFIDVVIPTTALPQVTASSTLTLATDWDTNHSMSLAPERTAWLIHTLGFNGRVNHYTGALWFYELVCSGQQYASATISFAGTPDPNLITSISIGRTYDPPDQTTPISHLNVIGDTAQTLAKAFELQINNGYTAIWAQANGAQLTIYARELGVSGNTLTISVSNPSTHLTAQVSGAAFSGGTDGKWLTDLQATPRINRAARDWHVSFFSALKNYGLDMTAAFSMELGNGDPSVATGIAQRYPSQAAVMVSTPALQTNFSSVSAAYWQQVYADMAVLQTAAGVTPYLQFGEVQWWYFPDDGSGMPFYDAFATSAFRSQYGRDMQVIRTNTIDPTTVSDEVAFLPQLIGNYTDQIIAFVRQTYPAARFEVLYPIDVNNTPLNTVVNYPHSSWTPQKLNCLKTESFTYTYSRSLELCKQSINAGIALGFSRSHCSHLIGIGDAHSPWLKETRLSKAAALESIVLFALDQFCLIGYPSPLPASGRRSLHMG